MIDRFGDEPVVSFDPAHPDVGWFLSGALPFERWPDGGPGWFGKLFGRMLARPVVGVLEWMVRVLWRVDRWQQQRKASSRT